MDILARIPSLLSPYANAAIKTKIHAAAICVVYHCFLRAKSAHKKGKKGSTGGALSKSRQQTRAGVWTYEQGH
jgi:hypothetical protein